MTIVIWRASGASFDIDAFLRHFPALSPDATWRKGEIGVGGRVATDSGFNKTLFEAASSEVVSAQIEKVLWQWRDVAETLVALGVAPMLDVGLVVGGERAFTASVFIDAKALQVLATLKIGLTVSAYPSND
ncbi:hypothetical protein LZ198_05715 [Myxococcus sp. K15C18031901]|uniref:hypothetical protein n=1 Tax=Myxococcus dinghuensis TaxID=2906761 RepID=UPI0020A75FA3|nr:hypothetical protein [Myxococcus dinghuensis]MCP3098374.1 hypothetical protein [Myxococcus dinghuensis]